MRRNILYEVYHKVMREYLNWIINERGSLNLCLFWTSDILRKGWHLMCQIFGRFIIYNKKTSFNTITTKLYSNEKTNVCIRNFSINSYSSRDTITNIALGVWPNNRRSSTCFGN
jgi:hypothetical protein